MKKYITIIALLCVSSVILRAEEGCTNCNKRPVTQNYARKAMCYDTDMTGSIENGTNAYLTDESSTMRDRYCEN